MIVIITVIILSLILNDNPLSKRTPVNFKWALCFNPTFITSSVELEYFLHITKKKKNLVTGETCPVAGALLF